MEAKLISAWKNTGSVGSVSALLKHTIMRRQWKDTDDDRNCSGDFADFFIRLHDLLNPGLQNKTQRHSRHSLPQHQGNWASSLQKTETEISHARHSNTHCLQFRCQHKHMFEFICHTIINNNNSKTIWIHSEWLKCERSVIRISWWLDLI